MYVDRLLCLYLINEQLEDDKAYAKLEEKESKEQKEPFLQLWYHLPSYSSFASDIID
jgi:hypothetical protein